MIKFKNLKTDEIKTAFSFREENEKVFIRFSEHGKEYGYSKNNIHIIIAENQLPFRVYSYTKNCYRCHNPTEILTYITYADNNEDIVFPCDFNRLLKEQDIIAHLKDPSIEYYGLSVIGDIEEYDLQLMEKYSERIKSTYSHTQRNVYPMNICSHCGAGQGWYFIYRDINQIIQERKEQCLNTYPPK